MAYGTILVDTLQSSAVLTAPVFNDSNGTQVGQLCKAWVSFVGATGVVNASFNVSSVTRVSTGTYTVNFTSAFPDTKYAVTGMTSSWAIAYTTLATTTCGLNAYTTTSGAATDTASSTVAFFR